VTRVPEGAASTGGGSTNGIENTGLLLLGFMLLAASGPALLFRRRVMART
jgi:LPXTG-motif cell wall-anchored protein